MSAKMKLGRIFQPLADNQETIRVGGNTVRECLFDFVKRNPASRNWVFDGPGNLISLVLLNGQTLHPGALDTRVTEADEIYLLAMIDGG